MTAQYVVLSVTLIVWVGIFSMVWRIDRRVTRLEKRSR